MPEMSLSQGLKYIYRGVWKYVYGFRHLYILALVLQGIADLIAISIPVLIGYAINELQRLSDEGVLNAFKYIVIVLCLVLVRWVAYAPGRLLERNAALNVRTAVLKDLTNTAIYAPLSFHDTRRSVELTQYINQIVTAIFSFSQSQFLYIRTAITIFIPLVILYILSPMIGFLSTIGYASLLLLIIHFDRKAYAVNKAAYDTSRKHFNIFSDCVSNILSIVTLRKQKIAMSQIEQKLDETIDPFKKDFTINELRWLATDLFSSFVFFGTLIFYVYQEYSKVGASAIALGGVYMVIEYGRQLSAVVNDLVRHASELNGYVAGYSAKVLFDSVEEVAQTWRNDSVSVNDTWSSLKISDALLPASQNRPRLNYLSLELKRGKSYALVGKSGAGKTSLLKVLAGVETLASGKVCLDDTPATQQYLASQATLICQEVQIFDGSLRYNIVFGGDHEDEALEKMTQISCISDFADNLDRDLVAGALSGGQRQRVALARGLLVAKDTTLILVDEPGASLDLETEQRVLTGILTSFPEACIVVSLHNMELVQIFDKVIQMSDGEAHQVVDGGNGTVTWKGAEHNLID